MLPANYPYPLILLTTPYVRDSQVWTHFVCTRVSVDPFPNAPTHACHMTGYYARIDSNVLVISENNYRNTNTGNEAEYEQIINVEATASEKAAFHVLRAASLYLISSGQFPGTLVVS